MAVSALPTSTAHPSGASRRSSALQSFGIRKKSEIDIVLDGKDEFVHSYSTFDEIKGHVNLRFGKDTPIDSLNITFQGQANTWVEKMTAMSPRTGRATARHVFLRLQQPIEGNPFPEDNIAKEGATYNIPFNFVVPEKALPFICSHGVEGEHVKEQHCYLPPSIGEEMLAGEGSVLMDDLCPSMAKVVYSIKVTVAKSTSSGRNREEIHNSVGIRIIPSRPEIVSDVSSPSKEGCLKYHLRKEKTVRKGLLKLGRKQGHLTAETSQPRSLRLPHQQEQNKEAVTTTATINFRYDPASLEEEPPQLSNVETRLKAFTFFGAAPFRHLPDPSNYDVWSLMHGQYSLTVDLSTMNLSSVRWTKHDPESPFAERMRHGSVATSASSKSQYRRKLSTSTGSASIGAAAPNTRLNRTLSNLSHSSSNSCTPTSSTTSLSTPASPTMTGSNTSFPGSVVVPPSSKYDQTLPYYTTSIIVPITLPSIHSSSSSNSSTSRSESTFSRRSSSAVTTPEDPNTTGSSLRRSSTTHVAQAVPSPTTSSTPFSRRRGIPTLLPTFHSCLVARSYVLELNVHANNPASQISLRTPIQIVSDPSPNDPPPPPVGAISSINAPLSWYDPFDLASTQRGDDQDTANDEAIARALGRGSSHADDQIPSYADLQIQMTNNVASYSSHHQGSDFTIPAAAQRRHNSMPLTSMPPALSETVADNPPEYNATLGFRRRQTMPLQPQSNASTVADATSRASGPDRSSSTSAPAARNQGRKASSGWTKRLGLRT